MANPAASWPGHYVKKTPATGNVLTYQETEVIVHPRDVKLAGGKKVLGNEKGQPNISQKEHDPSACSQEQHHWRQCKPYNTGKEGGLYWLDLLAASNQLLEKSGDWRISE
ncbi:hypothetical protein TREES_T100020821 [Tupaia chinensis]|uniref:Uncharacterized protein n=1 Tax=Tupaia chinensis TaxID=246437 RepID=L9JT43_TUPCH|nr:hypothetical protein TREES_T100020821 [Tupaia chinensis]